MRAPLIAPDGLKSLTERSSRRSRRLLDALDAAPDAPRVGDVYLLPLETDLLVYAVVIREYPTRPLSYLVLAADADPSTRDDRADLRVVPESDDASVEPVTLRGDRTARVEGAELPRARRVGCLRGDALRSAVSLPASARGAGGAPDDPELAATFADVDRVWRGLRTTGC